MTSATSARNDIITPDTLIALDTATHTGWAMLQRGVITSGVADFSVRTKATKTITADHPGRRFEMFYNWLGQMLAVNQCGSLNTVIIYEAVVGGSSAGGLVSLVQKGLEALLLCQACAHRIPVISFAPATIKKFATGSGQLSKESKAAVIENVRRRFPDQPFIPHRRTTAEPWDWDDNQCDALALLDLANAVLLNTESMDPAYLLDRAHTATIGRWGKKRKT